MYTNIYFVYSSSSSFKQIKCIIKYKETYNKVFHSITKSLYILNFYFKYKIMKIRMSSKNILTPDPYVFFTFETYILCQINTLKPYRNFYKFAKHWIACVLFLFYYKRIINHSINIWKIFICLHPLFQQLKNKQTIFIQKSIQQSSKNNRFYNYIFEPCLISRNVDFPMLLINFKKCL